MSEGITPFRVTFNKPNEGAPFFATEVEISRNLPLEERNHIAGLLAQLGFENMDCEGDDAGEWDYYAAYGDGYERNNGEES